MADEDNNQNGTDPKGILKRIADTWMIEPDHIHWHDGDTARYHGFSWWPGDFCLKARANWHDGETDKAVRIRIDTDFIRKLDVSKQDNWSFLSSMGHCYTSTYAWLHMPTDPQDVASVEVYEAFVPDRLWLSTTAYVREETASWLPEFVARMASLQPINAQIYAGELAGVLRAEPDVSISPSGPRASIDEILYVLPDVFAPAGREPSRWTGSEEFVNFAEKWGQSDNCFGIGDMSSLTLETPFGSDSALVRLLTDVAHPQLGNGLLVTLQLPMLNGAREIAKLTNELNFLEAVSWTGFPLFGCWHSREVGNGVMAAFSMFVPNALYSPMIATNAAFWMLHRAKWVKNSRFENLTDLPMIEILRRRTGLSL